MRIGIDAHLLGGAESGVELWIRHLLAALSQVDEGNEYVIYTHEGAMPIAHREGWSVDFRVHRRRVPLRAARIAWEQLVLPGLLKADGVDVLHAPGYVMPLRALVPTVLTVHDVIALKFPHLASRSNALHYRLLLPRSVRRARVVVASSETTKRDIVDLIRVDPAKVRVVSAGCDPLFEHAATPAEREQVARTYGLPERFLLFVGNVEPKKGLAVLLAALAQLEASGRWEHPLVVAGGKSWRRGRALAGLDALDEGRHVRFCGYVAREHLPALYALADLFVFPSLYEGFGFPPLEAMACGTPVVCSDAPALRETVGDAALIVPAQDAAALAAALRDVVEDEALRRGLAAKGTERVKAFSWARTAQGMIEAYQAAGEC